MGAAILASGSIELNTCLPRWQHRTKMAAPYQGDSTVVISEKMTENPVNISSPRHEIITRCLYNVVQSRYNVLPAGGKKYVVTIVRCIRTDNFPLREIGTLEKVRYNGGYVVTQFL